MVDVGPDNLTLAQQLSTGERLTAELIEHLKCGFLPKLEKLGQAVAARPGDLSYDHVKDVNVRNQVVELLKSERFTDEMFKRLQNFTAAIAEGAQRASQQ